MYDIFAGSSRLPPRCNDCKKGRLIIQRHNEIRDCLGDIASQVWTHVIKEPVVREADVNNGDGVLRLDLGIRGVWQPQVEALFDIRYIDHNPAASITCIGASCFLYVADDSWRLTS